MTALLVTDALVMAIWRRGRPQTLLHHSDQARQHTSEPFQRLTADHGIACSVSRSGNVWTMRRWRASSENGKELNERLQARLKQLEEARYSRTEPAT